MLASFILPGKFPVDNISLQRFWRISADMSAFSFYVLDRMLFPEVFFLSIFKIYFIISFLSIARNENKFWMLIWFLVSNMLGWNSYLLIHFSTGSKTSSETWFIIYGFPFISNSEAVFLKKVSSSLAILDHFLVTRFFQLVLYLVQVYLYSRKKVSLSSKWSHHYILQMKDLKFLKIFL